MSDIVICEPLRTPVGRMGGALAPLTVNQLATTVLTEIVRRTAAYEAKRRDARYVLETMCIGGGQGLAAVFEAVS